MTQPTGEDVAESEAEAVAEARADAWMYVTQAEEDYAEERRERRSYR